MVTSSQIASYIGLTPRAVRKWVTEELINPDYYTYQQDGSTRRLLINPEGLPEPHRTNFFRARAEESFQRISKELAEKSGRPAPGSPEEQWRDSTAFNSLAPFQKAYVERWMNIFENFGHLTGGDGSELDKELKRFSEKTGERYTWKTFYRNRKLYQEGGVAALAPQHGLHRRGESKLNPGDLDLYKKLYLSENRPNHKAVYALVRSEAELQGRNVRNFPHPETFRKALYKEVGPSERYRIRHGYRAWQRKYGQYVQRTVKELPAGAVWVGDNRPLDVWCTDPEINNGKPFRPNLSAWIDFKSRFWISHALYEGSPNADWQIQTLKWGMESYGTPGDGIYMDNGKDYKAADVMGILHILGIKHRNALPYNADAKIIEPMFRRQIERVEKFLGGYTGKNSEHRPEATTALMKRSRKALKKGAQQPKQIIAFSELKTLVAEFLETDNKTPIKSGELKHQTPEQAFYIGLDGQERRVKHIRPGTLDLLCMPVAEKKIGRNGVYCEKQKGWYWAPELMAEKGRTITYRRDPRLPGEIHVFLEGRPLCKAELQSEIHGWVGTPAEAAELQKRLERIRKEERRLAKMAKELGFQYTPAQLSERLEVDARIERRTLYERGLGPHPDTVHKGIKEMANHENDDMAAEFDRLRERDLPTDQDIKLGRHLESQHMAERFEDLSYEEKLKLLSPEVQQVAWDQPPELREEFVNKYAKDRFRKRYASSLFEVLHPTNK